MKHFAVAALIGFSAIAYGAPDWRDWKFEDHETIRRSFNVAATSDPKKVLVDNVSGYVHVSGSTGSQVEVIVQKRVKAESNAAVEEAKRDVKLDVSQQGNAVRLYVDGPFRNGNGVNYRGDQYYGYHVSFDYDIQVPAGTNLVLKTVNDGGIVVKGTTGDFEIHGLNGGIDMEDITGSGTVRTLNGKVKVTFRKNPEHDTDFRTLNGPMDIYFQPGLNAELDFKTLNGGVYADFDLTPRPAAADGTANINGKFVYRRNRTTTGRAGTGGPLLTFKGLNGSIRLHSKPI